MVVRGSSPMEVLSSLSFCSTLNPVRLTSTFTHDEIKPAWRRRTQSPMLRVAAISYRKFVHFALDETKLHTVLKPSPLQENYNSIKALDGKTELQMQAFRSPTIRLLRSMNIESESMQVLDFAAFPEPKYDAPIFCANFFTSVNMNIVVLDLNPLHDQPDYRKKYYKNLMPLYLKYAELLSWGGKLTAESIKFFSPMVIWTKFTSSETKHEALYSAFIEYYRVWLNLMDEATMETDASQVMRNQASQHRYLTWRAEKDSLFFMTLDPSGIEASRLIKLTSTDMGSHGVKDPGHGVLKRLIGETHAKELLRNFLFNGVDELGSATFLDYFPEYCCENGAISEKRSIIGKSYENRPWDSNGDFIGENMQG